MHILMFGKSGQVATELRRLCPDGSLTALGRSEVDLTDPAGCAQAVSRSDADVVINAAAYTAVDQAEEEQAVAATINGEAPTAMARAAAVRGLPFLHLSSDYVYGGEGSAPFAPDAIPAPLGAYGRTKLQGDIGVSSAGGPHAILRTSWVFSAHGTNFVKTMLRVARQRERVSVVSDQVGGPTPAAEIAAALITMSRAFVDGRARSGIYHFSGAPEVSWAGFAREIFREADLAVSVNDIPSSEWPAPAKRPGNSRLDCESTRRVFGLQRPDWRIGLRDVIKELGGHGND